MLYHRWEYTAQSNERMIVQPDGCCDVLLISQFGKPARIKVTQWDSQPYAVCTQVETSFIGYRLRPGTTISTNILTHEDVDIAQIEDIIEVETNMNLEICELIHALTQPNATVAKIARQNGTSTRTLQRQFSNLSLPIPDFWRLLGRARRAVRALPVKVPLKEICYAYGYSDQAHMTREFVRWFGYSPTQLRNDKLTIDNICQPGLGSWLNDSHSEIRNLF